MEAFALPRNAAIAPVGAESVALPPLASKRQSSEFTSTPVKRRKLSSATASPSSPTSSTASTPHKASTRPNMTASSSITLDMLRPHFEEPLAKVAASFGICVTLLKKICRRHGIARWPHRQITGLRKSIASMEHAIGYFDGARRESYAEQLLKQKNKLAALLEDPTTSNPALASEEDHHDCGRRQPKVPAPAIDNGYEVRASSPTGPLLPESPYYGAVVAPQPPSVYLPYPAEPSYTQRYHQLCPPPAQRPVEVQPATGYYASTGIPSNPTIHLPPLRRQSGSVLPPISSLVAGGSLPPASSW